MEGTLRYEAVPQLQSVFAYGSETHVPDHDICRLSYYVKCCVVGCGIRMPLADDALLEYMTAHTLPVHLQELIKRMAFQELSLDKLLNSALILDENHTLLPLGTLNTFYEFKTASTYFTINSLTVGSGRQECVHKVMLCTFKWLQEYYINPFYREQQANPLIAAILNGGITADLLPALNLLSLELSLARQHQLGLVPQVVPSASAAGQRPLEEQECNLREQRHVPSAVTSGSGSTNMIAFPEATEVQALTERDAIVPDVPMAIAELVNEESLASNVVEASATLLDSRFLENNRL
ncbi:hypothetical protein IV203_017082 [Nitzschia inconspicua]|uniref:Uncharacterized protein n=1 Tax=Nitzschia inconspicua TaxID=303405 RepID=A0A9K3KR52_9STRA|nr:hypothetical protein IV203_017082 [Nitzschia inconspicua]